MYPLRTLGKRLRSHLLRLLGGVDGAAYDARRSLHRAEAAAAIKARREAAEARREAIFWREQNGRKPVATMLVGGEPAVTLLAAQGSPLADVGAPRGSVQTHRVIMQRVGFHLTMPPEMIPDGAREYMADMLARELATHLATHLAAHTKAQSSSSS